MVGVAVSVGVDVTVAVTVTVPVTVVEICEVGKGSPGAGGWGVTESSVGFAFSELTGALSMGVISPCSAAVVALSDGPAPQNSHKSTDPINIVIEYLAKSIDDSLRLQDD
jgi:hypothetical protein